MRMSGIKNSQEGDDGIIENEGAGESKGHDCTCIRFLTFPHMLCLLKLVSMTKSMLIYLSIYPSSYLSIYLSI